MLPQGVVELLHDTFRGQAIGDFAPTFGGFSHRTAVVTIGQRRCVVKLADAPAKRADVRHEARVLALLQGRGLPVPEVIALAENQDWTAAVTGWIAGENGIRLFAGPQHDLEPIYRALGRLLREIHQVRMEPPNRPPALIGRVARLQAQLAGMTIDPALGAALLEALSHPVWSDGPEGLTHGDAGIHNVLWDGRIAGLLDWEWSAWGATLLDLAWVRWTMRFREVPAQLWPAFLAEYGAPTDSFGDARSGRALVIGQIASILARVQHQPEARDEWLRRLHWTLALPLE